MPYGKTIVCPPVPPALPPIPQSFLAPAAGVINLGWFGIAFAPALGLYAACSITGNLNRIMTSPNGITWTVRGTPNNNTWEKITWSAPLGLFAAVSRTVIGVANHIMTSPDGIVWTLRSPILTNELFDIAWSDALGLFCAVGGTAGVGLGNHIQTSPDGITWTARNAPTNDAWRAVAPGKVGGLDAFCAVAGTGSGALTRIMTSFDGILWTTRTNPTAHNWEDVVYSPDLGLWVAVAGGNIAPLNSRIMTSPDGLVWTTRTNPVVNSSSSLTHVDWNPDQLQFLALIADTVNLTGQKMLTSPDGITWTLRTGPSDNAWEDAVWVGAPLNQWVAVNTAVAHVAIITAGIP